MSLAALRKIRDLPGVVVKDLPRYLRAMASSGAPHRSDHRGWISLCNRHENLIREAGRPGVNCSWKWGSRLHAVEMLPLLGRRLLEEALSEWPIQFHSKPLVISDQPKVSFIFAHSGRDRLSQLHSVVSTVFAQREVPCEVVIVDQTPHPLVAEFPKHVVYAHLAKDGVEPGWHKSWAFNVGARLSRGSILVFHDGDICVPEDYASNIAREIDKRGFKAASIQRLLFYLNSRDSKLVAAQRKFDALRLTPLMAFQNWKGGTIAIHRNAFESIGGFDEGFVDWGGEDDEFFDRCSDIGHCKFGYLPFVHLWHEPQADRGRQDNPNTTVVLPARLSIPIPVRIAELSDRQWGNRDSPDPCTSYKQDIKAHLS